MAGSWTSALRSVSLSSLCRVEIHHLNKRAYIDGHFEYVPPGYFFRKNEQVALAYDNAGLYHLCYMAAECDRYYWYSISKDADIHASYLMGTLQVSLADVTGKVHAYNVPVLFSSSSRVEIDNTIGRAMVNGLFAGVCLVVNAQDTPEETRAVLVHEFVHLLKSALPELSDTMYGETDAVKVEEIMTHLVTDKLSMLKTLDSLQFKQSSSSVPVYHYDDQKDEVDYSKVDGHIRTNHIADIADANGKTLITSNITIDGRKTADIEKYQKQRKEYYSL